MEKIILPLLAIGSLGYAAYIVFGAKALEKQKQNRVQISLLELSKMWTRHNEIVKETPVINEFETEELKELRNQQDEIASMQDKPVNDGNEIQNQPDETTT